MRLRLKKKETKVNIILSAYNGEKYIGEQISSIIDQTYKNWVLYIFDDGSSDLTENIVSEYARNYPEKIFFIKNDRNYGSTLSFLYGLKYVYNISSDKLNNTEQFYMFCDQDDVWLKDKIAVSLKVLNKMEKRHAAATPLSVFTDALIVDENLRFIKESFYKADKLKPRHTDLNRLLMENKCLGCTMMMNSAAAAVIRIPEEGIRYHDWWTALSVTAFGHIRYIKVPLIMYRQHSDNQVGQKDFAGYVSERTSSTDNIRNRLKLTFHQAEVFRDAYMTDLKERKLKTIEMFIRMEHEGFFKKRLICIKYRFFKSGFLRNIGIMFYL